ncbi:hypothetical protein DIJ64_12315 [Mycobacterium leprae]|uniref:SrcO n=1 Tax=Mycobacterium leprae TaxID=1769 RepID=Q50158_MYCLR|nr:hypothetical protein [Mycobacterium leprae]AAA63134.1 srcO [Mycobacterium leprae]AWV48552.1 hypothetical protein DIJ64_12315 [Mycobacterium leprae]OAR20330.1 hypothetical protein A8144_11300 [Mycobacterium leprae 3125609]OAX70659.1 hypothetical protein A3216_10670 [Mycobacterium leprae 7935681]
MLDIAELITQFSHFSPQPTDIALYEAKAGFAWPEPTVRALPGLAEKAVLTLQFDAPMLACDEEPLQR